MIILDWSTSFRNLCVLCAMVLVVGDYSLISLASTAKKWQGVRGVCRKHTMCAILYISYTITIYVQKWVTNLHGEEVHMEFPT